MELTRQELIAWAAGFVDGEGSIVLRMRHPSPVEQAKQRGNNSRHLGQIALSLSVAQTALEPLQRLQILFGGWINANPPRSERHARAWQWRIGDQHALDALVEMEPYLIRKQAQVSVAREFRALVGRTWGGHPVPDEIIEKRLVLREAMAVLNRRGPLP